VLDVAIQGQFGRAKDFAIANFKTGKEVILARRLPWSLGDLGHAGGLFHMLMLSLFELIFELNGTVWKNEAIESFILTLHSESTRHTWAQSRGRRTASRSTSSLGPSMSRAQTAFSPFKIEVIVLLRRLRLWLSGG
jgi:hypothetical protein